MIEFNYSEFQSIIFIEKKIPTVYSVDVVGEERYYQLVAQEAMGTVAYTCYINSVDDPNETFQFETKWKADCNKRIIIPGMTHDVQALMLQYLEEMATELKLMNKRMEYMIGSNIGHDDITEGD